MLLLIAVSQMIQSFEEFNITTAQRIINYWHDKGSYLEGLADYKRLTELGIRNAVVENEAGKTAFSLGNFDDALAAFSRAVNLDQKQNIYHFNFAIINYILGRKDLAYQSFTAGLNLDQSFKIPPVVRALFALSMFAQLKQNNVDIDRIES